MSTYTGEITRVLNAPNSDKLSPSKINGRVVCILDKFGRYDIMTFVKGMNRMENISESKIECEPGGAVSYGHAADAVDLMVFAGQSNMSGRGSADDAAVCSGSAGFEYKAVSNPYNLVPIEEPFGLNEDRRGGLCDIDLNGMTKRRGSMVSALVDTYYKKTGKTIEKTNEIDNKLYDFVLIGLHAIREELYK